jgi:hypothetical protein
MDRINNILSDVNSALTQQARSCDDMINDPRLTLEDMQELLEIQAIQKKLNQLKNTKAEDGDFLEVENTEIESIEQEMMEYKKDFYDMSVGSLMAIMSNAQKIVENLSNPQVAENLTESWLQGKIAITEDYMRTIHDFVMYVNQSDDNTEAANRPGLWENIRRKKERMGKNYKPAKTGDKDRPDSKTWKKLTDENKKV